MTITQTSKLKFNIQVSGGYTGTFSLTYQPKSDLYPGSSDTNDSSSLTQPLSKNFLMLAVQNRPFTTGVAVGTQANLPKTNGFSNDELVNQLNSLPDNLLKPFEYLALYYV